MISNLENSFLLSNVFRKITIPNEEKQLINGDYNNGWYYFEPNVLQEEVKRMYGMELPDESFTIGSGASCNYENGKYMYSYGGGSGMFSDNERKINRAYMQDEKLYIEDEYMYIEEVHLHSEYEPGIYVYTSSDKTNKIAEYDIDSITIDEVIEENSNKMQKYKSTFEKTEDGEYYWVSTEQID